MNIKDLDKNYDKLQKKYGDKNLYSIYNGGCENNPTICFIFMNPTGRNIASYETWKSRRSPWIGTKNIWKLFYKLDLLSPEIYEEIQRKKSKEWNEKFAEEVYEDVTKHKYFITNLGKCNQIDSRPLPNTVYKQYLDLLYKEIEIINPKIIITFGNQVSSIFLNQNISVSKCRKTKYIKTINQKEYEIYPTYYPVGNGMRNIDLAVEDIKYIIKSKFKEK